MFAITRAQAKQFRSVLRHTLLTLEPSGEWPLLVVKSAPGRTTLYAQKNDMTVQWCLPGTGALGDMAFRSSVLASVEGTASTTVTFLRRNKTQAVATWDQRKGKQSFDFALVSHHSIPPFPSLPKKWVPTRPEFLSALATVSSVTTANNSRYELSRIQLQGRFGQVAATDGRQMHIHRGFHLPWKDDLLIPSASVFGKSNLIPHVEGNLGKTKTHVVLQSGQWTLAFAVDTTSRFPDVIPVIPHANVFTTRLDLDGRDVEKVRENILHNSGNARSTQILLRLGKPVSVDAESLPRFELHHSNVRGKPMTVTFESSYLVRALDMGFREFRFTQAPKNLVVCQDRQRLYLWVALEPKPLVSPNPRHLATTA